MVDVHPKDAARNTKLLYNLNMPKRISAVRGVIGKINIYINRESAGLANSV